jgi:hypothetical protein
MLPCYCVVVLSLPAICVCIIEYCMQETVVYGKGAIKTLYWDCTVLVCMLRGTVTNPIKQFPVVLKP